MLCEATTTHVPAVFAEANPDLDELFEDNMFDSHPPQFSRFDTLVENVMMYVDGWVVRKALKRVTCDDCRSALVSQEVSTKYEDSCVFLKLKSNRG